MTQQRESDGFTLIELLVVIAILPLVVGAISVAILAVFNNEGSATNSLTSSGDAQITSASYVEDVQSANWIVTQQGLNVCPGPAGALILSLSPDNVASNVIRNVISYVAVPNPAGSNTNTIYREACTGFGTSGVAPTGKPTVLSHNALAGTTLTISPPSTATLAGQGWTPASGSTGIKLVLQEPATPNAGAAPASVYTYTLNAVPRVGGIGGAAPNSPGGGGGPVPILPVEFVGGQCPTQALTLNGATINDVPPGNMGPAGFSAASCPGNQSVSGFNSGPYTYGVQDPFNNSTFVLPPPPTPSVPSTPGSCVGTTTVVCGAGLYTVGSPACTPGNNYSFDASAGPVYFECPVSIGTVSVSFLGGSSLTNDTYYFEQGLTMKKSNVTFGSASYLFSPDGTGNDLNADTHTTITPTGAGMILYMEPGVGNVSIASGFSGNLTAPSSPYDGIVLWDAANSASTLGLGQGNGGGAGMLIGPGGIYAPNASVTMAGGYLLGSQFIVINNITMGGGTTGNISG